jgi:carboxylesterase type B
MIPGFAVRPGDYDATDERVARAMSGAVVQFARTADPNGRGLPKWTPYAPGETYLEYGDSFGQKQKLRDPYLDVLDPIFAAKRAAAAVKPAE